MDYSVKQFRYFLVLLILTSYIWFRYTGILSSNIDEYFFYILLILLWWYHYGGNSYLMSSERLSNFHRCSDLEYRYHVNTLFGILDTCYVRIKGYDRFWYYIDKPLSCGHGCNVAEFEKFCKYNSTAGELAETMDKCYKTNTKIRADYDLDASDYNTSKWFSLFWLLVIEFVILLILHHDDFGMHSHYGYYSY